MSFSLPVATAAYVASFLTGWSRDEITAIYPKRVDAIVAAQAEVARGLALLEAADTGDIDAVGDACEVLVSGLEPQDGYAAERIREIYRGMVGLLLWGGMWKTRMED